MLTGAQIALESLIREGVDTIFGYPGGANLWLYRYLPDYPKLHHVLVRHEQGGAHAADGYARSKRGSVGVVFATSGPGALNLVTGLATAYMDSVPVVAITGQVPSTAIGTDSFQESDVIGSTMSVVKHSYLITRVEDIAPTIKEAFHIARTGRPGPVLIDFPKDLQAAKTAFNYPEGPVRRRSYPAPPRPDPAKLRQIAELIKGAKRPVILAGRGVLIARAEEELAELLAKRPGDMPEAEVRRFLEGLPRRYLRLFSHTAIYRHVRLSRDIHPDEIHVSLEQKGSAWELAVVTLDKPFLFSNISGVLASFGMDILRGNAMTSPNGLVLDIFQFTDRERFLELRRMDWPGRT